jgi:hypothetical protein
VLRIARDWIHAFLKTLDPIAVENRRLSAHVIHGHGLHSIGPNEEWSLDGHDKLCRNMGIAIWGIVDKYSRLIIGHYAVPNNHLADTALACFLLLVEKSGGGSSLTKTNPITEDPHRNSNQSGCG